MNTFSLAPLYQRVSVAHFLPQHALRVGNHLFYLVHLNTKHAHTSINTEVS